MEVGSAVRRMTHLFSTLSIVGAIPWWIHTYAHKHATGAAQGFAVSCAGAGMQLRSTLVCGTLGSAVVTYVR